jgi:thiamine-phosphate pyrophosphorylase
MSLALHGDDNADGDRGFERLTRQCARLARSDIDFLQLREKDLPPRELAEVSRQVLRAVRAATAVTRVLIHSQLGVALSIGADGVHLSSRAEITAAQIRAEYRQAGLPEPAVSLSCHTLDEVRRAGEEGVSLILFGPIFGKTVAGVEVTPPAGLEALRAACTVAGPVPVLALGGVSPANSAACLEAGAAGIAAIRMFQTWAGCGHSMPMK